MRRAKTTTLTLGLVLPFLFGADPMPLPLPVAKRPLAKAPDVGSPDPTQLKSDAAALAREREEALKEAAAAGPATERAMLRAQLAELLKRINERPPVAFPKYPSGPTVKKSDFPLDGAKPIDAVRTAENLFREGEVDAAYRVLRLIDATLLPRPDRAFAQYLTACCLRKMNKRSEAAVVFREVAEAKDDDFIAECAVSQLAMIRTTQEIEAQIEQLRSRPKPR